MVRPAPGADVLDTELPGEPGAVEALADALALGVLPALDEAARVAAGARADIGIEWQGAFAQRSHAVLGELAERTRLAGIELRDVVDRLHDYAGRLRAAQSGLAQLRVDAEAAGLPVSGRLVLAPPGRECDLLPYRRRVEDLVATVEGAAERLQTDGTALPGLGWLMLGTEAVVTVAVGRWSHQAAGLRARAAAPADGSRSRGLVDRADGLAARGAWLSRGTGAVLTPAGVLVDHAEGESWGQAAVSQGAGAATGALAAGVTAAALTSWSGPAAIAVGFVVGSAAALGADRAVDAGYAGSRRRGSLAELTERCGRPGSRSERRERRDVADTRYGHR